jgi:hypothetical protein
MCKKIITVMLLLLFSTVGLAQNYVKPPVDGLWWNPTESGRGWAFETQDDVIVVTHYTYRADGSSTFYTTAGVWNGTGGFLPGGLSASEGGQCVGCPYIRPVSTDLGAMRFEFTSTLTGRAIYPNGTIIPIEKYDYVYSSARAYLKGDWASTWITSDGASSHTNIIRFDRDCVGSHCDTTMVDGRLVLTNPGRPAAGGKVPGTRGLYNVLIDSSPAFYDYYFIFGDSLRWSGFACTKLKTDPPPTNTSECSGMLFASRSNTRASIPTSASMTSPAPAVKLSTAQADPGVSYESGQMITNVPAEWKNVGPVSWTDLLSRMPK